nr:ankyrin repeat-containing protein At5g02620-like [Ipomoea batatas]GME14416.1 ankyrin repeat-containing protein At5g02620-like [Ipomoea batatas]
MKKISSTLGCFHCPDVEKQGEEGRHKALFDATIKGNWTSAEKILKEYPECATHSITIRNETVVHIAAAGKNKEFLEKLVKILEKKGDKSFSILAQRNTLGCSAFYFAVLSGVVDNAKVMVEKNKDLPTIRSKDKSDDIGKLPINHAALSGRKKMVAYLFQKTPFEMLLEADRIGLLQATIRYDMYDTALQIIDKDPLLATKEYDTQRNRTFLHLLARKDLTERSWRRFLVSTCAVFSARLWDTIQERTLAMKLLKKIWGEYLKLAEETLAGKIKKTEILHYAAKEGNVEFLSMILNSKPDLLWEFNSKEQNIFHIAVLHRQKDVFHFIYRFGPFKDLISVQRDNQQNNILHSAAKLRTSRSSKESTGDDNPQQPKITSYIHKVETDIPKSLLKVSGAALRLQRELLWFMVSKQLQN